eukprot:9549012-Ditylum_brightwellii.AAC.1
MDYFHTYPNARLRFFTSNMQLQVDSKAVYLVMPGAKKCFAGYFYLASHPHPLSYSGLPHNSPILVECRAPNNVVCSAAEAECSGLFHNTQNAVVIRIILEALGHPQIATKSKLTTAQQTCLYMLQCKSNTAELGTCVIIG